MRFLLDMPVSALLLDVLIAHGHEGIHAYQIGKDRAPDIELLEIARRENRIIITADLDSSAFGSQLSNRAGYNLV